MKRTHKKMAKVILKVLSDKKEHSYGDLERKANTNWKTVRDHVEFLELFDAVIISKENRVKITEFGVNILENI